MCGLEKGRLGSLSVRASAGRVDPVPTDHQTEQEEADMETERLLWRWTGVFTQVTDAGLRAWL